MRIGAVSAALGLVLCIGAGPKDDEIKPGTHTVSMESMRFHPDELTIAIGETVTITELDAFPAAGWKSSRSPEAATPENCSPAPQLGGSSIQKPVSGDRRTVPEVLAATRDQLQKGASHSIVPPVA